jgi:hypothetical protein
LIDTIYTIRRQFYHDIVARRPASSRFLRGWLGRIERVRAYSSRRAA